MNGVREEYGVKFTQNAKGVWSCDNLICYDKTIDEAIKRADKAMTDIEKLLANHNKED